MTKNISKSYYLQLEPKESAKMAKKGKIINVLADPESYQTGYKEGKEEARRIIIAHLRVIRASQSLRTRSRILNIIERIKELEL